MQPSRRPADQASISSYHSDAFTLPCQDVDDDVRSIASHDSFDSCNFARDMPS